MIFSLAPCSDRSGFPETCQELYPSPGLHCYFFLAFLGSTAGSCDCNSITKSLRVAFGNAPQASGKLILDAADKPIMSLLKE